MKKTIIITKEPLSTQGYNIVLSNNTSIIDLPREAGDVLITKDRITFKAISWCMFPVIWAGDILKVEPIDSKDLMIGDVVLYKTVGRAYAHRLIKIYEEDGRMYIVTGGEKEYRDNRFSEHSGGVSVDNILGKVVEIRRGSLCFKPDEVKLSSLSLIQGRIKLSIWTLFYKIRQGIAKILTKLQGFKLYRYFFKCLIGNRVLFLAGTPAIKNSKEVNNFCLYRKFDDFSNDFTGNEKLYNISARINNRPVGNISLGIEERDESKICTLSNLIVRIPYRGGGIGIQLINKALYLCNKIGVDKIQAFLSEEDTIAINLFKKLNFEILERENLYEKCE